MVRILGTIIVVSFKWIRMIGYLIFIELNFFHKEKYPSLYYREYLSIFYALDTEDGIIKLVKNKVTLIFLFKITFKPVTIIPSSYNFPLHSVIRYICGYLMLRI